MQVHSGWRTASLMAGALLIGAVIGPPLAQAASTALVRIEGAHSAHMAAVSKSGQLSVNAGLPTTSARQLDVALASPASEVVRFLPGPGTCVGAAADAYTIPKGKALIITAADFYTQAQTSPGAHASALVAGPVGTDPCVDTLAAASGADTVDYQNQVFPAGIAVPAGWALGIEDGGNELGSIEFYGYLVPAAAVPHNALENLHGDVPARSP